MKFPKNPFQDRINAMNSKDIDEGLKMDMLLNPLSKAEPKSDKSLGFQDVNSAVFPRYAFPKVNTLSASELSMKDLIDELQSQTILNNNIAPYVKKEIKSEVTAEMIKDFQNENAKPVEVNGVLYKFRPPEVDIDLQEVPPEFPDLATYQAEIRRSAEPIFRKIEEIQRQIQAIDDRNNYYFNEYRESRMARGEYYDFLDAIEPQRRTLYEELNELELARASMEKDYFGYDEIRQEYVANAEKIKAENNRALSNYEDELKSRNTGQSRPQAEDETDEEYKERLLATGRQIVDPATVQVQAQSYLFSTMKDRMSEMLQAYKVEAVLNQIIKVDGYEGLQVIKDRWPSLKKKLIDTFGDLRRVGSTDSIALFLLNETPENAKLVPPIPPAPTPAPISNTLVLNKSPPTRSNPAMATLIDTSFSPEPKVIEKHTPIPSDIFAPYAKLSARRRFANVPNVPDMYTSSSLMKPKLTPKGMFPPPPRENRGQLISDLPGNLAFKTPQFIPKTRKTTPIKTITRIKNPSNSSLEEYSGKFPIDVITADQLKYILEQNGLPVLFGNDVESKRMNYTRALTAGLIPDLPALLPKSKILEMSVPQLQQYLSDRGMTGRRGGDPLKQTDRSILLLMYDKYASPELRGSSANPPDLSGDEPLGKVRDIKTRFAIIDGEIQAGNNAPQLIRDARKLLKEMVTQKMVTLYEAQTHLKHLRKMNKI